MGKKKRLLMAIIFGFFIFGLLSTSFIVFTPQLGGAVKCDQDEKFEACLMEWFSNWNHDMNINGDMTLNGDLDVDGYGNFTGDLVVGGNANFTGNSTFSGYFETPCFNCENGDTYFHGDGFFEGNVTAPNIEVMETLIVHGNSTCTGTETKCNAIFNSGQCGWTTWTGQRGCRWRWFSSDCVGTATQCADMSTATCEEQQVCTLNTGAAGFVIDALGIGGNFTVNTSGNVIAEYFFGNGSFLTGVQTGTELWNTTEEMQDAIGSAFNSTLLYDDPANEMGVNESWVNETIDERTASITYLPIALEVVDGTLDDGNVSSINVSDTQSLNVSEVGGASPLTVVINFTGVEDITSMLLRLKYIGGSGHEIAIGLWDWDDDEYEEEYGEITDMDDFAFISISVWDSEDHIDPTDGNVSMQFRHIQNGNPSHDLLIDYASLVNGFSTTTISEHDALSGRDDKENHPWALPTDGTRDMSGNLNVGDNNITNATYVNGVSFWNITHIAADNKTIWEIRI